MRQLAGRARASSWAGMGIILKSFRGPLPPAAPSSARRQPGSGGAHPGIRRPQQLTRRAHPPAGRAQQLSAPVQSANNPGQRWPRALSSADRCAVGPAGPRRPPPGAGRQGHASGHQLPRQGPAGAAPALLCHGLASAGRRVQAGGHGGNPDRTRFSPATRSREAKRGEMRRHEG